ncbi:MAG: hypothetical protein AVDCRST_MAG49-2287 [uncultured Thermomicrobiales bacterium]|uniref:HTH luxR-type domain-containing protein n=1 Tax=uncultured Thermomicrobiales bacterium TaxID=1645740 RepID=A0A6J4UVD3_9BACT|nr:MAG: hypothetical protein AVDCRST_MAG49-2287 [uncultured Thermomicrobiales bacterium]
MASPWSRPEPDAGSWWSVAPAASLIGREREVAELRALLARPAARLVTVTGPGGVGKTVLAARTAADLAATAPDRYPDGVSFVALASVADPALVLPTIADTLGVRDIGDQPLTEQLAGALRGRRVLVVLDNLEHLLAAATDVASLLAACPEMQMLATSRERLRVVGEQEYPLAPLPLPDPGAASTAVALGTSPAVALFVERARATRPDFALDDAVAPTVAAICRRLDGLPLAIELAAARINLLPPVALLARLHRALPMLTYGPRDAPARQRTLRDAIAWSVDLLTAPEQTVYRRLGVFAGGFSLAASESVVPEAPSPLGRAVADPVERGDDRPEPSPWPGDDDGPSLLDGLSALVDKSLLQAGEGPDGEPRFVMLETVREDALERLEASGEAREVRGRLVAWCLALAEEAETGLIGPDQGQWLARLDGADDNLRAALGWALADGDATTALRLAAALWHYWDIRGRLTEGRAQLGRAVAAAEGAAVPAAVRARALTHLGHLHSDLGDYAEAAALYEEAIALLRGLEDRGELAGALNALGILRVTQGEFAKARALHTESLSIRQATGERRGVAVSVGYLGRVAYAEGDYAEARARDEAELAILHDLGDLDAIAYAAHALGQVAVGEGDLAQARAQFARSLALFEQLDDRFGIAYARRGLGQVALDSGDLPASATHLAASLAVRRAIGYRWGIVDAVEGIAEWAMARGQDPAAARLLGATEALREGLGAPLPPSERPRRQRVFTNLRARLGGAAFLAAMAEGRTHSLAMAADEAAAILAGTSGVALGDGPDPAPSDGPDPAPEGTPAPTAGPRAAGAGTGEPLSPREREVLRLLVDGRSDRDIAAALSISSRTASHHVARILAKLGVASRTAAATEAVRRRLL